MITNLNSTASLNKPLEVIDCGEIGGLVGCLKKAFEAQCDNRVGIKTPHIISLVHEVIQEHVRTHGENEVKE